MSGSPLLHHRSVSLPETWGLELPYSPNSIVVVNCRSPATSATCLCAGQWLCRASRLPCQGGAWRIVDLAGGVVFMLALRFDFHAGVERHNELRVACSGSRREAGEVGCLGMPVRGIGPVAAVEPPAVDPCAPTQRPFANHGLPAPLARASSCDTPRTCSGPA